MTTNPILERFSQVDVGAPNTDMGLEASREGNSIVFKPGKSYKRRSLVWSTVILCLLLSIFSRIIYESNPAPYSWIFIGALLTVSVTFITSMWRTPSFNKQFEIKTEEAQIVVYLPGMNERIVHTIEIDSIGSFLGTFDSKVDGHECNVYAVSNGYKINLTQESLGNDAALTRTIVYLLGFLCNKRSEMTTIGSYKDTTAICFDPNNE